MKNTILDNKENYKTFFIQHHKLNDNFFELEKHQQMFNLIYKYSLQSESLRIEQIEGFMHLYKNEIISIYKECSPKNVLLLFNFGEAFNKRVLSKISAGKKPQKYQRQEKLLFLQQQEKKRQEERQTELNNTREQCTKMLTELFASDNLNAHILEDFLNKNEYKIKVTLNCSLTFKGVMSCLNIPKGLRQRILDEQAVIKQQIKEKKEKERAEELRKRRERLAYLATLGLSYEVMITKSTLTNIFTEKVITEHFPLPFSEAQNPNLSRSYQKHYGLSMKLYRMADVMEAIKGGVPYRFKSELKPEYASMIEAFMIDSSLGETAKCSNGVLKV